MVVEEEEVSVISLIFSVPQTWNLRPKPETCTKVLQDRLLMCWPFLCWKKSSVGPRQFFLRVITVNLKKNKFKIQKSSVKKNNQIRTPGNQNKLCLSRKITKLTRKIIKLIKQ